MNEPATASRLPASLVSVMLIGLPLAIVSESVHPGYYPKLLLLHAGLVVLAFSAFRMRSPFPRSTLLLPVSAFLLVNVLSVTQAVNRVESVVILSHRFALLATFLLIVTLIDRRQLTGLFQVVCATSAVTSLIGIGQYAGLAGLDLPSAGMPSATFGYRNFAAAFTIATIPLIVAEIIRTSHSARRFAWTLALTLNTSFLLATRTRAAWGACLLSAGVCLAILIWKNRTSANNLSFPRWKNLSLLILAPIVIAIGFSSFVEPRMLGTGYDTHNREKTSLENAITSTFERGSDKERFDMWGHTLEMIASAPFLGVGIGNWQYVYPNFDRGQVSSKGGTPRRPHNDYLWISAETGLLGAVLFAWILIAAVRTSRRAAGAGRDRAAFLQIVAAIGSLVAIGAHSLFSFPLERIPVTFVGALCLAVLVLRDPAAPVQKPVSRRVWSILLVTQIAAATLLWRAVTFDRYAFRQSQATANQHWTDGVTFGTNALSLGILDPQVLLLRGLSYHMVGEFDQAIRDQERCLTYHPYLVNAINNLGMSLNGATRFDEAVHVLNRIATLNPGHVEQHLNLARSYAGMNQPGRAIRQLESARKKAPRRVDIALELAGFHERQGEMDRASALVSNALRNEPSDFLLHYRLGVIRQKQEEFDLAAFSFGRVVQLNAEYAPVYYNLGELNIARGDTANAIHAYQSFLDRWTGAPEAGRAVRLRLENLR